MWENTLRGILGGVGKKGMVGDEKFLTADSANDLENNGEDLTRSAHYGQDL